MGIGHLGAGHHWGVRSVSRIYTLTHIDASTHSYSRVYEHMHVCYAMHIVLHAMSTSRA